jgi:hypothetical protein
LISNCNIFYGPKINDSETIKLYFDRIFRMNEGLLLNAKLSNCQLYHGENKLIFDETALGLICVNRTRVPLIGPLELIGWFVYGV